MNKFGDLVKKVGVTAVIGLLVGGFVGYNLYEPKEITKEVITEIEVPVMQTQTVTVPADFVLVNGVQYDESSINSLLALGEESISSLVDKAKEDALSKFYKIDTVNGHEYELDEITVEDWNSDDISLELIDWEDKEYKLTFQKVEIQYDDDDDNEDDETYEVVVEYRKNESPKITFN